jgi:hypothetical protein
MAALARKTPRAMHGIAAAPWRAIAGPRFQVEDQAAFLR